jgi:hypothetical protein
LPHPWRTASKRRCAPPRCDRHRRGAGRRTRRATRREGPCSR